MRFFSVLSKWNFGKVRYFNANLFIYQSFLSPNPMLVLGIETSCDETGLAVFIVTGKQIGRAHV